MNVRLKFLGGAGSVTGSKYLMEIDDFKLLIDCGLFQGMKELRLRNWDSLPLDPASIDAVVLTHAHIDHSGYLPKLIKDGFAGPVYCTTPTHALLEIMLHDAAKLQEEEARFAKKKGYSKHEHPLALFTTPDVEKVLPMIKSVPLQVKTSVNESITFQFETSGHIMGAASIHLTLKGVNQEKIVVFSGDLGPFDSPLHFKPAPVGFADILIMESTYGDRLLPNRDIQQQLEDIVNMTDQNKGCLIIPAFSVGRTQLILYYLARLFQSGKIERRPVYIDSPMAISVTDLYRQFSSEHKLKDDLAPHYIFDDQSFHYVNSASGSKILNEIKHRAIILSASGMVTGGRILHHLFHRLRRSNDTVLFTGYQAEGSRGRSIIEKEPTVKIFGEEVPIKANIQEIQGLSAHADKQELLTWVDSVASPPKNTFIVHGEKPSATALQRDLQQKGWNAFVPNYLESFQLFQGI